MKAGRIIAIVVALVAGAGVFFLVISDGPDEAPIAQVVPKADKVETVRVLVSDAEFTRGQSINKEKVKWIRWPKKNLQPYMITDDNTDFYDKLNKAIAKSDIAFGEPIIKAKLLYPGSRGTMAALLTPGMQAVTMDVSLRQSAGGFILPGDRVDIFSSAGDGSVKTELVFSNVRVLAIDQTYNGPDGASKVGRTATLELAPAQVGRFITKRESTTLSMALKSIFQPEDTEELFQEVVPSKVVVIRYGQS
jgi:pilus assembly protein CpaB